MCVVGRVGIDDHLMAASALVATMNLRMTPNIIPRIVSPSSRLLWTMGKCCGILVPQTTKAIKPSSSQVVVQGGYTEFKYQSHKNLNGLINYTINRD